MKAEREQLDANSKDGKGGSEARLTTQARPRRNIMQKNLEYNHGLLWREEKELKKALYASLQETKKNRLCDGEANNNNVHLNSKSNAKKRKKDGLANGERMEDSAHMTPRRTKVHAQRKFAQGSNPNSPAPTPVKFRNNSSTALDLLPSKRPKTEDFLTFLCLRGTTVLPPALDFFGLASRSDASSESRCPSPTNSDIIEKTRVAGRHLVRTPNKNGKINRSIRLANLRRLKELSPDSDDSDMDDSEIEYDMILRHSRSVYDSNKKASEVNGRIGYCNSSLLHNKTKIIASSVQALKNKYKQQRLAKQKKEMVKKILDAKLTSKPETSANSNNKPSPKRRKGKSMVKANKKKPVPAKLAKTAKSKVLVAQPATNIQGKRNTPSKSFVPALPPKSDTTSSTPRNITMITRSVKEELDRAAFEASKHASDKDCKVDKKTTKKGGKNVVAAKKPLRSLRSSARNTRSAIMSDFSSDDDEPLVKKIKANLRKGEPLKKNSEIMKRLRKEKMMRLSGGKFLRSCVVNLGRNKEVPVLKTATGRPSRKTKEAATAYLELLGKKLSLPDPFDDGRKKKGPKNAGAMSKTSHSSDRGEQRQTRAKVEENKKAKINDTSSLRSRKNEVAKKTTKSNSKKKTPVAKQDASKNTNSSDTGKSKKQDSGNRDKPSRKNENTGTLKTNMFDSSSESSSETTSDSDDSVDFQKRLKLSSKLNSLKTPTKVKDARKNDDSTLYDSGSSIKSRSIKKLKHTEISPSMNIYPGLSESLADLSNFDDDVIVHDGEPTSITVKENVSSNSVAIQVNLVDDISEFDEDILEFAGSDFGSENSLTLDKILTPSCFLDSRLEASPKNRLESYLNSVNMPLELQKTKVKEETPVKSSTSSSPVSTPSKLKPVNKREQERSPCSASPPSGKRRGRPPGRKSVTKQCSERTSHRKMNDVFLSGSSKAKVVDAPTFHPTAAEFNDPLEYIEKIRPEAEKYGICRIIPPTSFKPECKINEEMRFTAHNQYIHKTMQRFGPNVLKMACIRHHLESQGGDFEHPILIGGMELDLPRLYETVEKHGGLKEVIEKKKWQKIADVLRIPKSAQDRVTKLYDAFCRYLLSYSTLSKDEQHKLESQVRAERNRKKNRVHTEIDECVTKGRSMCLSNFFRVARNTMSMWFKQDKPQPEEVETEYWKLVEDRQYHVCVHAGNVDSSAYGYGFPCNKNSPFGKHPWNLKVLTNNSDSVLRSMGPVMGVTIPTLHVGMLFTTGCWYRDPHCLPWIEYLHTGASKIWYSVPASQSKQFRNAMKQIVPEYSTSNPIWLPSDSAMVPPNILVEHGTSLCRIIQHSGQFVLVFPRAFTSTICCGYTVSESVYYAHEEWLNTAKEAFQEIRESCEPAVFSFERLLLCIASDARTSNHILQKIQPMIEEIRENELSLRKVLFDLGLKTSEHLPRYLEAKEMKRRSRDPSEEEYECEVCRSNCYISMVMYPQEEIVYCLSHAIEHLQKKKRDLKHFKLVYRYDQEELNDLCQKVAEKLNVHGQKKNIGKKTPKKKSL